ncbi:unnamed protein product [Orchesella dallaii]|uniref:GH16 domain-containing protein n=1 Tax=Orchesella dallaii TaxID=48710 RepID=A0ABP1RE53_9HEXA
MKFLHYCTTVLFCIALICCVANAWDWTGDIVFEDNFDGTSLDLNKWEYQETCGGEFGPGNLQCYTRNNVAVQNGNLVITARQERMEDKNFTSGRVRQRNVGFTYGAYVVRARFSRGDHLWPALWLLNLNTDCRYEEIDMAEYRGQRADSNKLIMAAHWGKAYNQIKSTYTTGTTPEDLSLGFHEYAVLWVPSKIEWYFDRQKYFEASLTNGTFTSDPNILPCRGGPTPYTDPSNFIFNIAVGGSFFSQYPPMDPSTWTKPTLEIDWVRVYQE